MARLLCRLVPKKVVNRRVDLERWGSNHSVVRVGRKAAVGFRYHVVLWVEQICRSGPEPLGSCLKVLVEAHNAMVLLRIYPDCHLLDGKQKRADHTVIVFFCVCGK